MEKGYIQVYTGNGKGKTTAALGQALRGAGNGYKSYILQFMKEYPYSEIKSLERLKEYIEIEQVCGDDFVYKKEKPSAGEIKKALDTLESVKNKMLGGYYDIIILDEACVAIYFGLLTPEDLISFIESKPENIELILTGRYCPDEIIERADLVTEMKEIKHYYASGVIARKGIES